MSFNPQQVAETVSEATAEPADTGRGGKKNKGISTAGKSPLQIAMARLRKDKIAMVCLGIIVLYVLLAIFAPALAALEGQDPGTSHPELLDVDGSRSSGGPPSTGSASSPRSAVTCSPGSSTEHVPRS